MHTSSISLENYALPKARRLLIKQLQEGRCVVPYHRTGFAGRRWQPRRGYNFTGDLHTHPGSFTYIKIPIRGCHGVVQARRLHGQDRPTQHMSEPQKKCTSGGQPAGSGTAHSKKNNKIRVSKSGGSKDAPPKQPVEVAAVVCKQQKAPCGSKAGLSVIDDIFGKPTAVVPPASRQADARGVRPRKNDSTQAKRSSPAAALAAGNAPASKKVRGILRRLFIHLRADKLRLCNTGPAPGTNQHICSCSRLDWPAKYDQARGAVVATGAD